MRTSYCCLVAKSCLTLCNPMDFSTPGLPVPHCYRALETRLSGKEIYKRGDIHICIADSLFCAVETNNTVKQTIL